MRDLDVGALPICGEDNRLKGVLTDRDIVVKCVAEGGDPAGTTVGRFGEGKPVTIGADDSIEEALQTMSAHQVRRLPVIDGHDLVGMLAQADVARHVNATRTADVVQDISKPTGDATTDSSSTPQQPPSTEISGGRYGGTES
jgi:CBS-domain-containing membrane protein